MICETKRCKGVKTHIVKKSLRHKEFRKCVSKKQNYYVNFKTINAKKHKLGTYNARKLGLSSFYDKRYVLDCKHNVLHSTNYLIHLKYTY